MAAGLRLPDDACVLHMIGEPAINPSWSIHTGVGTQAYTFIWGMPGENQTFDDMDQVRIVDLR